MVGGIYLAAVLRARLSAVAAVLLCGARILLKGLWRVWMHGGGRRGFVGAEAVFVGGGELDSGGGESAVSIGGIG